MSQETAEQKHLLEKKLNDALDEAWSKLNIAYDQARTASKDFPMSAWLAAEALEYSSVLFNLSHGLEDLDPQIRIKKKEDSIGLIQKSIGSLKRARELRRDSVTEAYASLRTAADSLKTVYLNTIKESAKKRS